MKEFILLLSGELNHDPGLSVEERQAEMLKYLNWLTSLKEKGIVKSGRPLDNQGRFLSNNDGIITDGPFLETKEAIGGYFIISSSSLDQATEIAKSCPHLLMGGNVEIRMLNEI